MSADGGCVAAGTTLAGHTAVSWSECPVNDSWRLLAGLPMKLIKNTGRDRVIDELRQTLASPSSLDLATPAFSLFAFAELRESLEELDACRMVLPAAGAGDLGLTGSDTDRAFRNRLQLRWLARECAAWITRKVELRGAPALLPQSILIAGQPESALHRVITGNCAFTTEGLGITPGNQFSLIQCSEQPEESAILGSWFTGLWNTLPASDQHKAAFLSRLQDLADPKAPSLIYYLTLFHIFKDLGDELDEERIVKSATGIRNTTVWKKLYKFQRDGVVGAIDKLERLGGCIIADSVGLGKTFEALAIIKYYELRNDRVLVLVPKRLRDNWTLYKANDRRNFLASDRFNYDVLNHTDLSRDGGTSGDIDLAHVNWGNYDLVVIDESHNFRNKATHNDRETRYDRLMRRIIKEGVKTRVLMLSATPVNNRLADLKNQIAFVTEGDDRPWTPTASRASRRPSARHSYSSTAGWPWKRPTARPARLIDMLGFRLLQAAGPADHRPLPQAHREVLRHQRDGALPGAAQAHQHQARRGPVPASSAPSAKSTTRSAASTSRPTRRCATSCPTSRRPTTPSTAPRSAAARASSGRWTARKASCISCV